MKPLRGFMCASRLFACGRNVVRVERLRITSCSQGRRKEAEKTAVPNKHRQRTLAGVKAGDPLLHSGERGENLYKNCAHRSERWSVNAQLYSALNNM